MKRTLILFATVVALLSCNKSPELKTSIIPIPQKIEKGNGYYKLGSNSQLSISTDALLPIAELIDSQLGSSKITTNENAQIKLVLQGDQKEGAYTITVNSDGIKIEAGSEVGIFYGAQTLIQLMEQNQDGSAYNIPYLTIADEPRFAYRGMHLDVARHFFDVDFVKKYIDLLAKYKMNTLHLHLTDAAGWRIEIKKYPLLTQKTAFRPARTWKEFWNEGDRKFAEEGDENAYGGYYTQEDIKDIVAYAQSKHITIIPEIEMPAHSEEVFVAYPDLCCSKKPYAEGDFCIGNEKVFEFIDGVLTEVIELFPSEYIHVAGDEASKASWKTCPLCQKRMKDNNLKDVDELQSYFMKRVEAMVEAKGRKAIGWDEILEGGLPPNATVMSWRGEEGGIKAAQQGHDVIMVPAGYCYLDAYQSNPQTEPEAIGGYVPLRKVYSYRPLPKELTEEEQKHILGIQGAIWTEYIPTEEYLEYMVLPRMLALAEIAWSEETDLDWSDFKHRLSDHFPALEKNGYNYHRPSYEIEMAMNVNQQKKEISIDFDTERDAPEIRYTTDGSVPTNTSPLYEGTIYLTGDNNLKAAIFENGKAMEPIFEQPINYHKAIGATVDYRLKNCPRYPAGGEAALVDGYRGGLGYGDGKWQGFTNDIDVVIDMGSVQPINSVSARFMQLIGPGVFMPTFVEVETSEDGKNFEKAFTEKNDVPMDKAELAFRDFGGKLDGKQARYIRFYAKNPKGYIFTDEILVD